MIEGVNISLGDRDYTVPALNFRGLKRHATDIALVCDADDARAHPFGDERLAAICRIAHSALARNYPKLTLATVEDGVDLNNAGAIIAAVLGVSGLEKKAPDVRTTPAQNPSTGTGSPAPSSPRPAGPGTTSANV